MDISTKFLALGIGYFLVLLFQLRVYVKPAAIAVFPVFHVLVILLFAFRSFAFMLAVSYSDGNSVKRVPHPEFEWALYDIGGVIGFAAYLSISWHMMHVLRWKQSRRAAKTARRRLRRRRASTTSSGLYRSTSGKGSDAYGALPGAPPPPAAVDAAAIQRGQLCTCNTVVFTSGTAVTASAALFVVSYLAMYALVFVTIDDTKHALEVLHLKCIPIFFLTGAGIVVLTSIALRGDRVRYPLYWCCCELRVRRRTLLLLAAGMGIAAMIAKICIMIYSIMYEWFPFDVDGVDQAWYYPCVDSLPLWVCFELLRPLLRTVPSSTAAENVIERMHIALELARLSGDDTDDEVTTVSSRGSDLAREAAGPARSVAHTGALMSAANDIDGDAGRHDLGAGRRDSVGMADAGDGLDDGGDVRVEVEAQEEKFSAEATMAAAARSAAAMEKQMSAFSRTVAAFEESVLDNFRDVQAQLAQATKTNRGNAQQIMSLKQMTRIVARMVAVQGDSNRLVASPPHRGAPAVTSRRRQQSLEGASAPVVRRRRDSRGRSAGRRHASQGVLPTRRQHQPHHHQRVGSYEPPRMVHQQQQQHQQPRRQNDETGSLHPQSPPLAPPPGHRRHYSSRSNGSRPPTAPPPLTSSRSQQSAGTSARSLHTGQGHSSRSFAGRGSGRTLGSDRSLGSAGSKDSFRSRRSVASAHVTTSHTHSGSPAGVAMQPRSPLQQHRQQ